MIVGSQIDDLAYSYELIHSTFFNVKSAFVISTIDPLYR
jgi:hypothetical protein